MADSELQQLRDLKANLVKQAYKLHDELKRNGCKPRGREILFKDLLSKFCEESNGFERSPTLDKHKARLCDVSQSIVGVQFKDVDKNWICDNIYCYNAQVTSKVLQFAIDLTVDVEEKGYVVQDINCHFIGLDKCYLQEIASWIQRFTREKNFSYLISGISDYSDQSFIRAKILRTLESKGYISMNKCRNKGGGIYVYVHPPGAEDRVFFKCQWYTEFVERSWRIEHIFVIDPLKAGEAFVIANEDLLQGFCRIGLRKADLEDLWDRLCTAINDAKFKS